MRMRPDRNQRNVSSFSFSRLRFWWRWSRAPERRWLWYLAAGVLYATVALVPMNGLDAEARGALAVFAVAGFLWATNTLPLAVTAILVFFLLPVSGALTREEAYAYFGNHAVFFILGAFILASPVMRSGLSTRLALLVIQRFGKSPRALLASVLFTPGVMSFVVNEHAVVVMFFPIVMELARALGVRPGSRYGLALFLALGWGAIIGGAATLLGGARAPLALGMLQAATGANIGFLSWLWSTLPAVVGLFFVALFLVWRLGTGTDISLAVARRHLEARVQALGPMSPREVYTAGVMLFTVALWILWGNTWGLGTIAFLGVLLAFLLRVADWREVEEDVNWGIFLMYGSAIALSAALRDTGAAAWVAERVLSSWIDAPALMFFALVLLAMGLTEAMSNAAAVAVLMPVALALAAEYGLDPRTVTLGVAVPAGLAFLLPVGTPAIAIVVGSGYVRPLEAFRYGLWLKVMGLILFALVSRYYWPVIGLGG